MKMTKTWPAQTACALLLAACNLALEPEGDEAAQGTSSPDPAAGRATGTDGREGPPMGSDGGPPAACTLAYDLADGMDEPTNPSLRLDVDGSPDGDPGSTLTCVDGNAATFDPCPCYGASPPAECEVLGSRWTPRPPPPVWAPGIRVYVELCMGGFDPPPDQPTLPQRLEELQDRCEAVSAEVACSIPASDASCYWVAVQF